MLFSSTHKQKYPCYGVGVKKIKSELSVGHILVLAKDVEKSILFYEAIGLPAFMKLEHMAIIELRGGAHLILMQKGTEASADLKPSSYGGQDKSSNETLDFMISGNSQEDLEVFRSQLLANKAEATEIEKGDFGHFTFTVNDPDGNKIYFYTSHEIKYMPE